MEGSALSRSAPEVEAEAGSSCLWYRQALFLQLLPQSPRLGTVWESGAQAHGTGSQWDPRRPFSALRLWIW